MLKLYDYMDYAIQEFNERNYLVEKKLAYFYSEILEMLELEMDELGALKKTFEVLETLHISIDANFKKVYRFNGNELILDWKVSPLACYLILINSNTSNENVAKAQIYFALNNFSNSKK